MTSKLSTWPHSASFQPHVRPDLSVVTYLCPACRRLLVIKGVAWQISGAIELTFHEHLISCEWVEDVSWPFVFQLNDTTGGFLPGLVVVNKVPQTLLADLDDAGKNMRVYAAQVALLAVNSTVTVNNVEWDFSEGDGIQLTYRLSDGSELKATDDGGTAEQISYQLYKQLYRRSH